VRATYRVHDLGRLRLGKIGYFLKARRARRLIRSLRPDVVHAHYATSYGLLGALSGVHPLVVTSHGSDVLISGARRPSRWLVARVLGAADLVTVPGEHVAEQVRRLSTAREVVVFQYGVEVQRLREVAAAVEADEHEVTETRLVTARPLQPLYHTDDVIRAVALLRDGGLDCTLDVADRGPERPALEQLVRELGLADRVVFHGYVPENDAERLIARADVYVSVAASDGASIALLEAMALGPAPVVSDIAANRSWIDDGVNGVLVSIEPQAIAEGVRRALALDRAACRERNLAIVSERADRERNLGECERLLARLVAERRRPDAYSEDMSGESS
jgi:glycosyltransferase involved in cell wall biosynthesis